MSLTAHSWRIRAYKVSRFHTGQADGMGDVDAMAGGNNRFRWCGNFTDEVDYRFIIDRFEVVNDQQCALPRQHVAQQLSLA